MSVASPASPPVLVVGAGPVGLTVASLLAALDVPVLVAERNRATSNEAKAISLDAESLRTLGSAGLGEQVEQVIVPGTGTRYYDRRDRMLFQARGGRPYQLGYAFKNQFAQPELEDVLARVLAATDTEVRFGTELTGLADHDHGVTAELRDLASGTVSDVPVSWVAACDGGRSTVRQLLGIDMSGRNHADMWLVLDTTEDHHRERYGMHHGNPGRPTVIVPGRDGRCRYEFRLRDGEGAPGEPPAAELVERLLAPYRTIAPAQVERSVVYRFNALVADSWRSGHCFLLGDAAHMMPPFAGQGLNSGVRDAANLAWKLAMVWHQAASPELLDTYEMERRPHAQATVEFSERLGRVVMTTSRARALVRDLAVRTALLIPAGRRYLQDMRYRPGARHAAGVVSRVAGGAPLAGSLLPQPWVMAAPALRLQRLDEVLGGGLTLLGVDVSAREWDEVLAVFARRALPAPRGIDVALGDRLPAASGQRPSIADADGVLEEVLAPACGKFVLVKPDRYVAAVFGAAHAADVAAELSRWLRSPLPEAAARTPGGHGPAYEAAV